LVCSIALVSCGGGSNVVPTQPQEAPAAPSQPATSTGNPTSALSTITIGNSDRNAVASHGAIHTHYSPIKKLNTGTKTQSVVYASDLKYFGGPLITLARVFNGYVNSTPSAFGNVKAFEQNLSRSNFSHILDQYVGATGSNRYDFGADVSVSYPALTTLGDNDLLLIIHATAAGLAGGGSNHIYNIFLPKGLDYCGTGTLIPAGLCNGSVTSPNPAFCAFHGAVNFSDIGTTLFTVIPYQDLNFCSINGFTANPKGPTPNGVQQDSTYSAVSHEVFETITDPLIDSWINPDPFYPAEIGDLCSYVTGQFVNGAVVPQNTVLNGVTYRIQFEYSNARHGCSNANP
jgi:hypothetical protein